MSSSTRSSTKASESRAGGRPRNAGRGLVTADCLRMETARASLTVSDGHRRASWKERASPSSALLHAGQPVTSMSRKRTRPPSGGVKPETMSKIVVLPAPLGPMSPRIWPSCNSRSTWSTARTPP